MGLPIAWSRIVKSFYGNGFFLDWVAMWFLPALFVMNLVAFVFYRLFGRFNLPWPRWIALALMQTIGVLTLDTFMSFDLNLLGRSLTLQGLPFSLDLALVGGFFFVLGREVYRNVPQDWFGSWWLLVASAVLLLALAWFFPATIDLNTRRWDAPLLNTVEALIGIVLVLAVSWQLARGPAWLVSFFSYMGRISVLILIFHNPVQSYLTGKLDWLIGSLGFSVKSAAFWGMSVPQTRARSYPKMRGFTTEIPKEPCIAILDQQNGCIAAKGNGMPGAAFDIVKNAIFHHMGDHFFNHIVAFAHKEHGLTLKQDKDLVGFVMALEVRDPVGLKFVQIAQNGYTPAIKIDQRLVTFAQVFVHFKQIFVHKFGSR
jgi:fucose 4-O-acetylase-like acetyltransferase